jgi:cell division protein FtsQ
MMKFVEKFLSLWPRGKKRKRHTRHPSVSRNELRSGPSFIAPDAQRASSQPGLLGRLRTRFQRAARRKDLKIRPTPTSKRGQGWLIPLCFLVVLTAGGWLAYRPLMQAVTGIGVFKIQDIVIIGCRVTTPALIRELAAIRYQGSLLSLNSGYITAILRTHPWIASAEVERQWPNGVVITIQEFEAEALIVQETAGQNLLYYLDKSGVAFVALEPGQDMDLPVITGLEAKEGEGLPTRTSEARALLKLVRQNNPNLPLQNLSEIHIDKDEGLTVYLADYPFPIYLGKGEIRTRYSRLKRVLEALYKEGSGGETGMAEVSFIRMDYLENKVLVGTQQNGLKKDG